jgi:spore germination protein KB
VILIKANKSTISPAQLATLLFAISSGSAIVYIPHPISDAAGNDAWLSLIIAYGFGVTVLACVLYLYHQHEGMSLVAYSRKLIGNILTVGVVILVIGMLLFAVSAIISSIGDFFTTIMMDRTPAYVFNSISMLLAALTARAGISVTARMFILNVLVMVIFTVAVLMLAIPIYNPGYLLPLLDSGIKPVLHGAFISAGFPFGEVALFSMLLPYVNRQKRATLNRNLYTAYTMTAILLLLSTLCTTMAFGAAAGYFKYSLYRIASEIQLIEIFQRIESVIGIALILGSYMKATLMLIILNQLFVQLFRLKDERLLIYPLALLCIFFSLTMFKTPSDFVEQVYVIWPFTVIAVGCTLIFMFTVLTWIRNLAQD